MNRRGFLKLASAAPIALPTMVKAAAASGPAAVYDNGAMLSGFVGEYYTISPPTGDYFRVSGNHENPFPRAMDRRA